MGLARVYYKEPESKICQRTGNPVSKEIVSGAAANKKAYADSLFEHVCAHHY